LLDGRISVGGISYSLVTGRAGVRIPVLLGEFLFSKPVLRPPSFLCNSYRVPFPGGKAVWARRWSHTTIYRPRLWTGRHTGILWGDPYFYI